MKTDTQITFFSVCMCVSVRVRVLCCSYMVSKVHDPVGVNAQRAAQQAEGIGKLSAATHSGFQQSAQTRQGAHNMT